MGGRANWPEESQNGGRQRALARRLDWNAWPPCCRSWRSVSCKSEPSPASSRSDRRTKWLRKNGSRRSINTQSPNLRNTHSAGRKPIGPSGSSCDAWRAWADSWAVKAMAFPVGSPSGGACPNSSFSTRAANLATKNVGNTERLCVGMPGHPKCVRMATQSRGHGTQRSFQTTKNTMNTKGRFSLCSACPLWFPPRTHHTTHVVGRALC